MGDINIEWAETNPGRVWRSIDGRYAIIANTLPENPPITVYQARKIDLSMASAHPERGTLGYLLGESPWCWNTENSVHSAEAVIERDAFRSAHDDDVPADHSAVSLERFFWPISDGTSRAALAIVAKDDQIVAQVIGMVRDGDGYTPQPWVEINLTDLGIQVNVEVWNRSDHGPETCGCGAKAGAPHAERCERAVCLVTGEQRLLCEYFGGSPVAGVEAVVTNSQSEFEAYFKTPTGHDCGQDVWRGE